MQLPCVSSLSLFTRSDNYIPSDSCCRPASGESAGDVPPATTLQQLRPSAWQLPPRGHLILEYSLGGWVTIAGHATWLFLPQYLLLYRPGSQCVTLPVSEGPQDQPGSHDVLGEPPGLSNSGAHIPTPCTQ